MMKVSEHCIMEELGNDLDPFATLTRYTKLGELVIERFKEGYVMCRAKNIGWMRLEGYKVFAIDTYRDPYDVGIAFIEEFCPHCDWTARVYSLNEESGLYFNITHHDNPVNGDSYYLTPITEEVYERMT